MGYTTVRSPMTMGLPRARTIEEPDKLVWTKETGDQRAFASRLQAQCDRASIPSALDHGRQPISAPSTRAIPLATAVPSDMDSLTSGWTPPLGRGSRQAAYSCQDTAVGRLRAHCLTYLRPEPSAASPQRSSFPRGGPCPAFKSGSTPGLAVTSSGTSGATPMPYSMGNRPRGIRSANLDSFAIPIPPSATYGVMQTMWHNKLYHIRTSEATTMCNPVKIAEQFYTLAEAANWLGVERHTVWRWIKAGRMDSQKVGGVVFIERRVVDDLIKKRNGREEA